MKKLGNDHMRSKFFILILFLAFILSLSLLNNEANAFERGHTKIITGLKVEEQWDSNIFYDSTDEKDDFITIITPSVKGEFGFGANGKHKIRADYLVDIGIFGKYNDQNYGNHDVLGEIFLDLNDYRLSISDNFLFTSSRAGTEFESRTLRKENTGRAVFGADFNKVAFDIGYSHYIVDYLSTLLKAIERYENTGWVTGYVQIMPKTRALLEYQYRNIQYDNATGRNANAHSILTGITGDITAKITGTVKVGYKFKGYIDSTRDDFSSAVVYTGLTYDPMERLNIALFYHREAIESTYKTNNFYTGDHVLLGVNYDLPSNFIIKANGQFFHNDYPEISPGDTEERRDIEWAIGGGIDYVIKDWLTAGVGYRFHQRDSNIGTRDYDQHVISTDIRLVF